MGRSAQREDRLAVADDTPKAGNILTRKIGPAPTWAYAVAAAVGAFVVIKHRSSGTNGTGATSDTSDTDADSTSSDDTQDEIDALQNQVSGDDSGLGDPADTASPAVYSGPGSSSTDPIWVSNPTPGPSGTAHTKVNHVVTVFANDDSVRKVLAQYGITLAELNKINPSKRYTLGSKIKPGTKIYIPNGAKRTVPPAPLGLKGK